MIKKIAFSVGLGVLATSISALSETFNFSNYSVKPTFAAGVLSDQGKYAVAWHSNQSEGWIVDNAGKSYQPFQPNTAVSNLQPSQILSLNDDQFLVIYNKVGFGSYGGYGQVYDGNGIMLGQTVKLTEKISSNVYSTEDVWSAVLANGNIVVAWAEHLYDDDGELDGSSVYAQIFSPHLQKIGNVIEVSTPFSGRPGTYRSDTRVAAFENGDFLVSFEADKFYGRRFNDSGFPKRSEEFVIGDSASVDHEPSVLALSDSRYIVAWTTGTQGTHETHIQVMNGNDKRIGSPVTLTHSGDTRVEIEGLTKRSTRNFWVSYGVNINGLYTLASQAFRLEEDNSLTSLQGDEGMILGAAFDHADDEYNFIPQRAGILLRYRGNRYVNVRLSDSKKLIGEQLIGAQCEGAEGDWTQLCALPAPKSENN
ncbi:MAG: hypothetical protein H7A00_03740 [Hahellaceae bacterium]|nr:hypothetical protein [Hahellaceae bacterium]